MMIIRRKRNKGVTLIELLVVIAIMMTMLTLVAPLAINSVDRVRAQDEYLAFCSLLRKTSIEAFLNHQIVRVELAQNEMRVITIQPSSFTPASNENNDQNVERRAFQFLEFNNQEFSFNHNGLPSINSIQLVQKERTKQVDLLDLLKN